MYDANVRGGLEVYMDKSYGKGLTIFYRTSLAGGIMEVTGDLITYPIMEPDIPGENDPQDGVYEKGISECGHILPHMHIKNEESGMCLDDEEVVLVHFKLPEKVVQEKSLVTVARVNFGVSWKSQEDLRYIHDAIIICAENFTEEGQIVDIIFPEEITKAVHIRRNISNEV